MDLLSRVLVAPESAILRTVEHVITLAAGAYVLKRLSALDLAELKKDVLGLLIRAAQNVPSLNEKIQEEQEKIAKDIEEHVLGIVPDAKAHVTLPHQGAPLATILEECSELWAGDRSFHNNRRLAGIYYNDKSELHELHEKVYGTFLATNLLFAGVFKSCRKMEAEVVSMIVTMLHGNNNSGGTLASGGTEAILLAIKAHRDWARTKGIINGNIIAPISAHPALNKACQYFNIELISVPMRKDMRADVDAMARLINRNTIMFYASAPSYPHGVVDPIEELGAVAAHYNIGLHVDNCFGGIILSSMSNIGLFDKPFDFRVKGVTSISVDVHKYGCTPKGISVIAYSDKTMNHFQYTIAVNWPGGLYCTPTMQGSRSGAVVATAWATMLYFGEEGYNTMAKRLHDGILKVVEVVNTTPGLQLVAVPDACTVAFTSTQFNIHSFLDIMAERGWGLIALQHPAAVAFVVGERLLLTMDEFIADLRQVTSDLLASPNKSQPTQGTAALYGNAKLLPASAILPSLMTYLDLHYKVKTVDSQ